MTGFFSSWSFFFLSSFLSLPRVSKPTPAHFQSNHFIYFSFIFVPCFLLLFILFWIIYIIEIFFQFNPPLVFFNFHIWFDFLKCSLD
jgi:hypothetical protein